MGKVVQLRPRHGVRRRVRTGVKFDAAAMLHEHEMAGRNLAALATSPLCALAHRDLPSA